MLGPMPGPTPGPVSPPQRRFSERFARRWAHRARVIEAVALFVVAAFAQRFVSMPRWSGVLGTPGEVPADWEGRSVVTLPVRAATPAELHTLRALRRARRLVPWSPRCLVEATAGQVLLRQLGSAGVVVIGLRPPPPPHRPDEPWEAHAWLVGRTGALSGGPAATGFTATTVFEVPDGLRAAEVELGPGATHAS